MSFVRKNWLIVVLATLTLGLLIALAGTLYYYKSGSSKETIAATVNGMPIERSELILYLNEITTREQLAQWQTLDQVPPKVLDTVIKNAALDKLIVAVARKESEVLDNKEVQARIEKVTNSIIRSSYLQSLAPTMVNDTDIKKRYEELADSLKGKKEYHAQHILLANKKEANTIKTALKQHSFEKLAKLFSLDEATAQRGGDLGYVLEGELNPEFEKAVSKLKIGQPSNPFKTKLGWHIAIVHDRRESKPLPYEQAIPVVRRKLEKERVQGYLENLLAEAKLEILINKSE